MQVIIREKIISPTLMSQKEITAPFLTEHF